MKVIEENMTQQEMFVKDINAFFNNEYAWQLVDGDVFSVRYMTEQEVLESIVDDILNVTMLEKTTGKKCFFGFSKLTRFLDSEWRNKIKVLLNHDSISGLICCTPATIEHFSASINELLLENILKKGSHKQIRIKDDRAILQAAMDFCGCWYEGFPPPEGVKLLQFNTEKINSEIHKFGSIENLSQSLAMDITARIQKSDKTTLN